MAPNVTLTLVEGVKIVVPDSLDLLTPYVLREQQDCFEDETKFLRHLLQPGQQVMDIGANYGVYTHSMARKVGASGRVWAFEPAPLAIQIERTADKQVVPIEHERAVAAAFDGDITVFN